MHQARDPPLGRRQGLEALHDHGAGVPESGGGHRALVTTREALSIEHGPYVGVPQEIDDLRDGLAKLVCVHSVLPRFVLLR